MKYYLIAPNIHVAKYYIGKTGANPFNAVIMCGRFDIERLRGLRNVTVTVLNQFMCEPEVVDFVSIAAKLSKIKLEYENV